MELTSSSTCPECGTPLVSGGLVCPRCGQPKVEMKVDVSKPDVYCPKEKKRVPIWWCLGSLVQGRETCPELVEARVNFPENRAEVRCKAQV